MRKDPGATEAPAPWSAGNAAQASQQAGPNNTTIAAHVHHLRSALALSKQALRGDSTSRDRSHSWTLSTVDDAAWFALRAGLRRAYESLLVAVTTHTTWGEDALGVAFGAIAHTAYHLGAIRQRLASTGIDFRLPPALPISRRQSRSKRHSSRGRRTRSRTR